MNLLHKYMNGNTNVSIYDDGTKVREYDGEPKPVHPESFDCKITNHCTGDENNKLCQWCHEVSSPQGRHADLGRLSQVIASLPAGVEIACGGGDPLSHPDIFSFLKAIKNQGLIANITINQRHLKKHESLLNELIKDKYLYGIGVSYSDSRYLNDICKLQSITDNVVFHVIMGVNTVEVIDELYEACKSNNKCKILILGYKEYGLGKKFYSIERNKIEENKLRWYRYLAKYFNRDNLTLSFDNLAISQLNLKRFFTDKLWEKFWMGSEGKYSMFVDAVNQQYAICSVDPNRVSFNDMSMLDFFQNIPEQSY